MAIMKESVKLHLSAAIAKCTHLSCGLFQDDVASLECCNFDMKNEMSGEETCGEQASDEQVIPVSGESEL